MANNKSGAAPEFGPVALFGSGETSPAGRKVFEYLLRPLKDMPQVALLETPAGFEPNSDRVIGRIGEFLEHSLQNYHPQVTSVPARRRETRFSPDNPEINAPLLEADLIFLGPGSPTYAVRQLQDSLAWHYLTARQRLGASLALASAAVVAASAYALPVYEIYKVGEDLHWKPGLDFFGPYGLPLVFVPHWNNNDGGEELDTSRCFMGRERFRRLMRLLPPELTVVGIDEATALVLEPSSSQARVIGLGGVTLIHTGHRHPPPEQEAPPDASLEEIARIRGGHVHIYTNGEVFPLSVCCPMEIPAPDEGIPADVWAQARAVEGERRQAAAEEPDAPPEVQSLVAERQAARSAKDWARADEIRDQIAARGWEVRDTPEGPEVSRQ